MHPEPRPQLPFEARVERLYDVGGVYGSPDGRRESVEREQLRHVHVFPKRRVRFAPFADERAEKRLRLAFRLGGIDGLEIVQYPLPVLLPRPGRHVPSDVDEAALLLGRGEGLGYGFRHPLEAVGDEKQRAADPPLPEAFQAFSPFRRGFAGEDPESEDLLPALLGYADGYHHAFPLVSAAPAVVAPPHGEPRPVEVGYRALWERPGIEFLRLAVASLDDREDEPFGHVDADLGLEVSADVGAGHPLRVEPAHLGVEIVDAAAVSAYDPFLEQAEPVPRYPRVYDAGRPTPGGGALPAFSIHIIRQWSPRSCGP